MARPNRARPTSLYALTVPGIETLVARELEGAGARVTESLTRFDKRDSLLILQAPAIPPLLKCGLIEDLFVVLLDLKITPVRGAPKRAAAALTRAALDHAMRLHHEALPKTRGRSFKVVARVAGRHEFRREDVETAFSRALGVLLPHWVATREAAAVELWAHVIGDRLIVGVRVSGDDMAQRSYKRAHLPASLKPVVARTLVALSEPEGDDIFIDAMCGAGTVLRERANSSPARLVLGGDIDPVAVAAARTNGGRRCRIARWDATSLPLRSSSVDVVVSNPPYGRQHGEIKGLDRLYARSVREFARVLRPGGRCVVLTGEPSVLQRALPPSLNVRRRQRMLLRGLPVTAFVMVRT